MRLPSFLLLPAMGVSIVLAFVATKIYARFPASWDEGCHGNADCLGWGVITSLPIYYSLKAIFFAVAGAVVPLPIWLCILATRKKAEGGRKSSPEVGSKTLFHRIKDGVGPDA